MIFIVSYSEVQFNNVTFHNNEAHNTKMISLQGRATLLIANSTFNSNHLGLNGGIFHVSLGGLLKVISCIFSNNKGFGNGILFYIINTYQMTELEVNNY